MFTIYVFKIENLIIRISNEKKGEKKKFIRIKMLKFQILYKTIIITIHS